MYEDSQITRGEFIRVLFAVGLFGAMSAPILSPVVNPALPFRDDYKPKKQDCLEGKIKTGVFNRNIGRGNPYAVGHKDDKIIMTSAEYAHLASQDSWFFDRVRVKSELTDYLRDARLKENILHLGLEPGIN